MIALPRRSFLSGIIAACAAPAIIRTQGLLMPIKPGLVGAGVFSVGDVITIHGSGARGSYVITWVCENGAFGGEGWRVIR